MHAGPDGETTLRAEVIRNDEIEFAVRLPRPIASRVGESWRVRYYCGLSAWEFVASVAGCDGQRLVLNHSETIRFINRRRFPRVPIEGHALIAYLPFSRAGSSGADARTPDLASLSSDRNPRMGDMPIFADARVMELAGPGLRVETSLQVHTGDRVLVISTLYHGRRAGASGGWNTIAGIGRVRHCRSIDSGMSIALELTGLSDTEIDELAYITAQLSSRRGDGREDVETAAAHLVGAGMDPSS